MCTYALSTIFQWSNTYINSVKILKFCVNNILKSILNKEKAPVSIFQLVQTRHKVELIAVTAFKTVNKVTVLRIDVVIVGQSLTSLALAFAWSCGGLNLSFATHAPYRTVGTMKILIFFAGFLATAAANTTPAKLVCYYDSKSYVRECKCIFIILLRVFYFYINTVSRYLPSNCT